MLCLRALLEFCPVASVPMERVIATTINANINRKVFIFMSYFYSLRHTKCNLGNEK